MVTPRCAKDHGLYLFFEEEEAEKLITGTLSGAPSLLWDLAIWLLGELQGF